jgi:hypothetical protein
MDLIALGAFNTHLSMYVNTAAIIYGPNLEKAIGDGGNQGIV